MGYLLGADIGSQSIKVVLLDPDGTTVATAGRPCEMHHPAAGWAEQDPAQWRTGLAAAIRDVVAAAGIRPAEVSHLGLASQVDGVVPVSAALEPLSPAIIWLDRRASAEAEAMSAKLGVEFHVTGTSFEVIIPGLSSGRFDAGFSSFGVTAERLKAPYAELDTGHYPMLSMPAELTALLTAA